MASYSSFKKVDSDAIIDLQVQSSDIADNTIAAAKIADDAVTGAKIAGTVTSAKINPTIDISGKTVTYRPIVNADISATASIAGTKLATGAATGNLGYTPLNSAGDTATGQMTVASSSTAITSSVGSGLALGWQGVADTLYFRTNTTSNAGYIDSSGRVQFQQKPSFCAMGTAGWLYVNSWTPAASGEFSLDSRFGWSLQYETGGPGWSSSTGRYTAPVAGYYQFNTMYYLLNDANTAPHYVHCFFRKNDSRTWNNSQNPYTINLHGMTSSYDDGVSMSAVMYLAATDYCSLAIVFHGASTRVHAGHQFFNGYLVT